MNPPDDRSLLQIQQTRDPDGLALRLCGVLDGSSYRTVRDAIVKAALDEPRIVVIDVSALQVPAPSAWSVFTSARWLLRDWPEVPIGLVCTHPRGRRAIRRNGIERYVPVYGATDLAIAALHTHATPPRRRVRQTWPAEWWAVSAAQRFVAQWLSDWALDELIVTASVVATVLVDNVLRHTTSGPDVRLETDGVTVTVAVTDSSSLFAGVHEDSEACGCLNEAADRLRALAELGKHSHCRRKGRLVGDGTGELPLAVAARDSVSMRRLAGRMAGTDSSEPVVCVPSSTRHGWAAAPPSPDEVVTDAGWTSRRRRHRRRGDERTRTRRRGHLDGAV